MDQRKNREMVDNSFNTAEMKKSKKLREGETQLLTIELKSKTKRKEKDHISHTKTEETHYADDKYQEF